MAIVAAVELFAAGALGRLLPDADAKLGKVEPEAKCDDGMAGGRRASFDRALANVGVAGWPIFGAAWRLILAGVITATVPLPAVAQEHHPLHRNYYRFWMQPGDPGVSCCNARVPSPLGGEIGDCEPTKAELLRNPDTGLVQWRAFVRQTGTWIWIEDNKLVRYPNPNIFDGHLCWTQASGTLCFRPPDTGG
jgi:hypothetical protein